MPRDRFAMVFYRTMAAVPSPKNNDWIPWLFVTTPTLFYVALQATNSKRFRQALNTPEIPAALSGVLALAITAFPKLTEGWGQPWLFFLALVLVVWILASVLRRETKSNERHAQVVKSMALFARSRGWKLNNEIHSLLGEYQKALTALKQSGQTDAELQLSAGNLRARIESRYYKEYFEPVALLVDQLALFGVSLKTIGSHVGGTAFQFQDIKAVANDLPLLLHRIDTVEFE